MNKQKKVLLYFFIFAAMGTNSHAGIEPLRNGAVVGRHVFALVKDSQNKPLQQQGKIKIYSQKPCQHDLAMANKQYRVSVFSQEVGAIYLSYPDKSKQKWLDTENIALGGVKGLYFPDCGQKTPWGSILSSETGLLDARDRKKLKRIFTPYLGASIKTASPYDYGWLFEVILLDQQGHVKVIKNYAAGRTAASQVLLMPDQKTIYLYDGKFSGHLYLFIADKAASLSQGRLYVLYEQEGRIQYQLLGKGSALKMKFKLKKMRFNRIFKHKPLKKQQCAKGYKIANSYYGQECLKLQKRNKKYAGLFEPIRFAAYLGIKPLLTKGLTLLPVRNGLQVFQQKTLQQAFVFAPGSSLNSNFIIRKSK